MDKIGKHKVTRLVLLMALIVPTIMVVLAYAANVGLEWTDPPPSSTAGAPTGHKVYRSTDAAVCDNPNSVLPPYRTLDTVTSTFADVVPDVNGKVCYEVTAFNEGGESPHSNRAVQGTTVNPPQAPTLRVTR